MKRDRFTFEISLSVLDHLGRNLYRSFATVLGEAISNSWDANADNVWIYIDREKNSLLIKDDGDGMTADDFQNKFLKIGYSKRKKGENVSTKGRRYIGRKGIGKLALLSCAEKIMVISKIENAEYVGGLIDNSGLDRAITEDLTPSEYPLDQYNLTIFGKHIENHKKGTIVGFENIREGVRNSFEFLKKTIALYFRFSLVDVAFNIYLNDEKVTLDDLSDLAQNTEFLWNINNLSDPFVNEKVTKLKENVKNISMDGKVKGFIASVEKPRHLKIISTDEKVGVDLFVNGRLRERDILKHIPTDRVAVSYLYGQIHVDELDDEKDRFTSSREGIVADDQKYKQFLEKLREKLSIILEDWDEWRIKNRKEGDPENQRIFETINWRSSIMNLKETLIALLPIIVAWFGSIIGAYKYGKKSSIKDYRQKAQQNRYSLIYAPLMKISMHTFISSRQSFPYDALSIRLSRARKFLQKLKFLTAIKATFDRGEERRSGETEFGTNFSLEKIKKIAVENAEWVDIELLNLIAMAERGRYETHASNYEITKEELNVAEHIDKMYNKLNKKLLPK